MVALRVLRHHVLQTCIPFWAHRGFNADSNLFRERVSLDGTPDLKQPTRCMVQARQVFSLCVAAKLTGACEYQEIVARGVDGLRRSFLADRGARGCYYSADPTGRPLDERRDTYAHAFVILALATATEVLGDDSLLKDVERLVQYLLSDLSDGELGSFLSSDQPTDRTVRLQNPHMHLLEALLAAEQTVSTGRYSELACCIVERFRSSMYVTALDVVAERFDAEWQAPTPVDSITWEPGHQFEWAWLLDWYARLANVAKLPEGEFMARTALRLGVTDLGVTDEVTGHRVVAHPSYRLWPQTELIKAVAIGTFETDSLNALAVAVDSLNSRFLGQAHPGCWLDRLDESGRPLSEWVPASSLYHLMMAMSEVDHLIEKLERPAP